MQYVSLAQLHLVMHGEGSVYLNTFHPNVRQFFRQPGGNPLHFLHKEHFISTRNILPALTHYPQENNKCEWILFIGDCLELVAFVNYLV